MFPRHPRRKAAALVVLGSATIVSFAFGQTSAVANPLSGVSGITSIVSDLPLASALPTNMLPLEGTADSVVMDVDGEEQELDTQMVDVTQNRAKSDSVRMYALPMLPTGDLTSSLPTAPISPDAAGVSDEAMSKVAWILNQTQGVTVPTANPAGVPGVDLVQEVSDGVDLNVAGLNKKHAVAATQAAVWHYTAGADLVKKRNAAPVNKLYEQLTGPANVGSPLPTNLPLMSGPTSSLMPSADTLPEPLKNLSGSLVGPFAVADGLQSLDVDVADAPNGLQIKDESGDDVEEMRAGQRYYAAIPKTADPGQAVMQVVSDPMSLTGTLLGGVDAGSMLTNPLVVAHGGAQPMRQSKSIAWGTSELVPNAGVSPVCTPNGVGVNLDNSRRSEQMAVKINGKDVSVPAGKTHVTEVKAEEGAKYDIEVAHAGRTVHMNGTRACEAEKVALNKAENNAAGQGGGKMPETGVAIGGMLAAGALLVGGGIAFYVVARRRKGAAVS